MPFGGRWSVAGFEQREPLGNGSEGEGGHTGRLCMQMVPWLLEGQDGQFKVPPDYIGQDGSATCS